MNASIDALELNMARVNELGGLYQAIKNLTTSAIDASDILRAQHVPAVSALDNFIHDLTRLGMLQVFDGLRPATAAYLKFRMPMQALSSGELGASLRASFEAEIRSQHSFLSFQHPDRIADAVRLVSSVELWATVAPTIGLSAKDVKERVRLIVDRRNKIAHEADIDPSYPGARWPIHASDVEDSAQLLHRICSAVYAAVQN